MSGPTDPPPDTDTEAQALAIVQHMLDLARAGDPELLEYVDAGAPVTMRDMSGNSLLMLAAYHGHAQLVTGLARRGADVDQINDRSQSPLAGAVFKKSPDVVAALLEAGADPDHGTPSARETAAYFQVPELAALIERARPRS